MKKFYRCLFALLAICMALSPVALADSFAGDAQLSITTGLPTQKPYTPYIVQIDNAGGARPQKGLAQADVVYEAEMQNGGYTRYTILFNDALPEIVEPVRSARILHADLAADWNATFIHYGGQSDSGTNVFDYIAKNGVAHIDGIGAGGGYFYRDSNREAPHNVICKLRELAAAKPSAPVEKSPLKFDAENYTRQGDPVKTFEITYKAGYVPSYSYNAEDGLYYRFYGREAQLDGETGEQLMCANVIIMYAEYSYYDYNGSRPVAELFGKNLCTYFIDGYCFQGYWTRGDIADSTHYFDAQGNEVVFKPGKTFIQVLREGKEVKMM